MAAKRHKTRKSRSVALWLLFSLCLCVSAVNISCGSKPTDLRALVPAETLVYLETNDLAAALQPIVDSKPFTEVAKSKPDFSALKGVQLAVAVTGFETSEQKLTDEHSVGRVQPHFVAIADTHAWNFQAVGFAEKKLGAFVENIYDSAPTVEKSDKNGGKYFIWTAKDGRKAYALVIDSIIYFGNDETAIDKCLAVRRGEADSIIKSGKVPPADRATLASGYVSTDGIAEIANIVGLKFASEAGEDSEVQSAIAGILPQLLRSSITEISWAATKTEQGIEDKYKIGMPPEIANVFSETMSPASAPSLTADILALKPSIVTLYNFKNPQIALRSLMLVTQKQTDAMAAKILGSFLLALLEPYGIRDPERFLSQARSAVITMKCDGNGEDPLLAMEYADILEIKKSTANDLILRKGWPGMGRTTPQGKDMPYQSTLLASKDNEIGAFYDGRVLAIGSLNCVEPLSEILGPPTDIVGGNKLPDAFLKTNAPIVSIAKDKDTAAPVAELLSELKPGAEATGWLYLTETRFTKSGIERRTLSDFGLIGSIIAQLAQD